ncbi:MAG TPA: antitoxin [Ruminococcaceae bacterium]|nr:antitoxin [Oscillospiraceae bacterium]
MKTTDKERLKKIVKTWASLQKQMDGHHITREMLLDDQFSQWAVTTPLYNIGEQVYMLSPDFKKEHSDIPWSVVSGLRHRLVHDYEGINWSIIVEVIFDEMDGFIASINRLI